MIIFQLEEEKKLYFTDMVGHGYSKKHNERMTIEHYITNVIIKIFLWLIEIPDVCNNVPNYNSHDYREWKTETIKLY